MSGRPCKPAGKHKLFTLSLWPKHMLIAGQGAALYLVSPRWTCKGSLLCCVLLAKSLVRVGQHRTWWLGTCAGQDVSTMLSCAHNC